jgi:hypothetical protein
MPEALLLIVEASGIGSSSTLKRQPNAVASLRNVYSSNRSQPFSYRERAATEVFALRASCDSDKPFSRRRCFSLWEILYGTMLVIIYDKRINVN